MPSVCRSFDTVAVGLEMNNMCTAAGKHAVRFNVMSVCLFLSTILFSWDIALQGSTVVHQSYRGGFAVDFPDLGMKKEDANVNTEIRYDPSISVVESYAKGVSGKDWLGSDEWKFSVSYERGFQVLPIEVKSIKTKMLIGSNVVSEKELPATGANELRSQHTCEKGGLQSVFLVIQSPGKRYILEFSELKKDKKQKLSKLDRDMFFSSFRAFESKESLAVPPLDVLKQNRSDSALGIEMIWIEPGNFQMGSPKDEVGHKNNEAQAEVQLRHGYWLASTETTQEQWTKLVGTTPYAPASTQNIKVFYPLGADLPVILVSREDALEFCALLTDIERAEGRIGPEWCYTLPTEAQWEFACRAGSQAAYCFGDNPEPLNRFAWFAANVKRDGYTPYPIMPVGRKEKNDYGLFDMHGNVSEYCLDLGDEKKAFPGGEEPVSLKGREIMRGGNYGSSSEDCRSAVRFPRPSHKYNTGFRIALVKSEPSDLERIQALRLAQRKSVYEPQSAVVNIHQAISQEELEVKSSVLSGDLSLPVEMIWCPAGTFLMGSRVLESYDHTGKNLGPRDVSCQPTCISRGFWISKTELTNGEAFRLGWVEEAVDRSRNDYPVSLKYRHVLKACRSLTESERKAGRLPSGFEYRLPTEAEWEYACRAGTTTRFFWGDNPQLAEGYRIVARTSFQNSVGEVMSHQPNPWGIHDMIGNHSEWCLDSYKPYLQGGIDPFCSDGDFVYPVVRGSQNSYNRERDYAPIIDSADGKKIGLHGVRLVLARPIGLSMVK